MQYDDGWYLASVPPFGANAAYSIYGVLEGTKDGGCRAAHYINSFVTTGGVEAFTAALSAIGIDMPVNSNNGQAITSECQMPNDFELDYDNYYDGNNNEQEEARALDGSYHYTAGLTSFGVGCVSNQFVKMEFDGALCQGANAV